MWLKWKTLPSMFGESDDSGDDATAWARSRSPTPREGAMVATSSSGIAAPPRVETSSASDHLTRSTEWHAWLLEFMGPRKATWGRQSRKLIVESMFTGMNPTAFCLAQGGMDFDDRVGAERKPHAHQFMRQNNILPKQCYTEAKSMMTAALAHSQSGYVRSDFFTAGFPCQPYSMQPRRALAPHEHPLFDCADLTFEYILRTRPRVALLENTTRFLDHPSGLPALQKKLESCYHIGWAKMNLKVWLDVARPRAYLWLIAKDIGTSEDCLVVHDNIRLAEASRPGEFRARVEDFMFAPGSDEWRRKVIPLQCRGGSAVSRAEAITKGEEKALQHYDPKEKVAMGRLRGLRATPRQQAMFQALVAARCLAQRCATSDAAAVADAVKGFKWDFSQNLPAKSKESFKSSVQGPMGCMLRSSLPFSFEHDRVILAEEIIRSHGWQMGAMVPDCSGIREVDVRDLAGEMQAIQSISVVMWAVMAAVGGKIEGLFVPDR